jgi:peptidoglycan/xylan/chitin deacetylase (PgdA/CDA1 family)
MRAVSVVLATSAVGRRFAALTHTARALAEAAGAPSVIVTYGREAPSPGPSDNGDVQLIVHSANEHRGSALLAGARHAQTSQCLLVDDMLGVDEALVRAHRRRQADADDLVTVGGLWPTLPAGRLTPITRDPLYAFAMHGARNACVPRAPLVRLAGLEALDDPVATYRLAQQLRAHGVSFVGIEDAVACEAPRGARALAHGKAAASLYAEDPATLRQSGLGSFKEGSLGRIVLRNTLTSVPGAIRAVDALALAAPAPALRRKLRLVSSDARFWRGARSAADRETWRRMKSGVTILMYHAFATEGEPASRYVLPGRTLARQLTVLRVLRRRVISLGSYVALRQSHALPPARTVVVTIDDGYQDVYDVAAPILTAHDCPATVFIVSGRVGQRAEWPADGPLRDRPLAGWQQLRDGLDAGLDVGAHTRTHPRLTELADAAAAEEIRGSRRELGDRLHRSVTTFAYPHGDEDARTHQLVVEAGFAGACTVRAGKNGPCEPLERLRRVEIRGDQGLVRFVLAVVLGRRSVGAPRPKNESD